MPYFIKKVADGWTTIKDDGEVLGRHKTKQAAIDQMIAISLAEGIPVGGERAVPAGSYSPPEGVAAAAKRALKWISEGYAGSGFTAVGRARAVQLASGRDISGDTVNRMISYFARHEVDKQATGFNFGDDGFPSAGRVAWDAWGGDAGQSWVNGLNSSVEGRAIGDGVVLSDFDDTLFMSGKLNEVVYNFIESADADLYIVTGRKEATRVETVADLERLGIDYDRLIMQPDDQNDSAVFKGSVAKSLLDGGVNVLFAVENNAEARAAYRSAGVQRVFDPANLPNEMIGVRIMPDNLMPEGEETLKSKVDDLKGEVLELIGNLVEVVDKLDDLVEATEPVDVMPEAVVEVVPTVDSMPMGEEDSVRFVEPTQVAELAKRGERVSKGIERRQAIQDLEIRAEGDGMTLRGYVAIFNSPSQPLPFTEVIMPGAFADSLRSRNDIKLLWNHDTGVVLGSTRAGTLKLTEDQRGLFAEAILPDTQAGRDAATLIKRGDVSAFSFGFRVPKGGDNWPSADQRVLTRINIHEASLVAFPAYTATDGTASVRGMSDLTSKIVALAELRGISADELTDALLALEAGEELTERQGELLTDTLSKVLQKDPEVTNPAALLDLKKKQLDLLMKRV